MYYSTLLVTGNDICPQTSEEISFCIMIVFIGAFLESYIIGGITAEMQKTDGNIQTFQKNFDYVNHSMELHHFPEAFRN